MPDSLFCSFLANAFLVESRFDHHALRLWLHIATSGNSGLFFIFQPLGEIRHVGVQTDEIKNASNRTTIDIFDIDHLMRYLVIVFNTTGQIIILWHEFPSQIPIITAGIDQGLNHRRPYVMARRITAVDSSALTVSYREFGQLAGYCFCSPANLQSAERAPGTFFYTSLTHISSFSRFSALQPKPVFLSGGQ